MRFIMSGSLVELGLGDRIDCVVWSIMMTGELGERIDCVWCVVCDLSESTNT